MNQFKSVKEIPKAAKSHLNSTPSILIKLLEKLETLDDNLEIISAYADDNMIIAKHRGDLKRLIKMVETEFGKLNLKLNKKKMRDYESHEKST
jgi:hypothetical protein